jgi:hypothetical protein
MFAKLLWDHETVLELQDVLVIWKPHNMFHMRCQTSPNESPKPTVPGLYILTFTAATVLLSKK